MDSQASDSDTVESRRQSRRKGLSFTTPQSVSVPQSTNAASLPKRGEDIEREAVLGWH